ncbi:hypothetical protein AAZX31_20G037300 [Glycine max]|uniref:Uncharacterized protein n=1 Tax=Glycine max TaxID=3847 RepID=A0A0R0EIJ7_SOYBN|nr:hypothetical protein JHK86_055097 [Glycine max]KAG4909226.1 hypothetical protein JHK87_055342 [Glycine soja]KAG4917787.1 hypothetical protein JHK85_056068 [Glycine max]KAG5073888.1 hypothetical protein JHK84_055119 [Glycine max]KAG5076565.1 hypothetical protein JHK82_055260 [Glycine max]
MKPNFSFLSKLLILQYLSVLCISQEFDFFYFVQQWPGAYCDTKQSCCYPKTGKPAIYHILVLETYFSLTAELDIDFVHEKVVFKDLAVQHVPATAQIADILTKSLSS